MSAFGYLSWNPFFQSKKNLFFSHPCGSFLPRKALYFALRYPSRHTSRNTLYAIKAYRNGSGLADFPQFWKSNAFCLLNLRFANFSANIGNGYPVYTSSLSALKRLGQNISTEKRRRERYPKGGHSEDRTKQTVCVGTRNTIDARQSRAAIPRNWKPRAPATCMQVRRFKNLSVGVARKTLYGAWGLDFWQPLLLSLLPLAPCNYNFSLIKYSEWATRLLFCSPLK